ncbi:hypothetical protein K435DRAFT_691219 [Dendrothele bispora CBS 962.96]|uniref:Uncharacterized protein n=1 Tax=Dendrothele bispora (strain CBS 962.96) TaxID=1314807 RepID=A0A4S8L2A3_DENBC|nr:hypothetical protein K435DRAFT_691219 [Dendrothele bispora CBS 962.96]
MFISFDTCFRLKRKRISSWKRDPSLQDGWLYFLSPSQMRFQMSTCTGLAALDHANTKFNEGYSETGKGAGLCARHEILLKNGIGALQVGERCLYKNCLTIFDADIVLIYANMDYIAASLMRHISSLLFLVLSYDIVCQWSKNLLQRLKKLPTSLRLHLTIRVLFFVIPKLHILGHLIKCQEDYSLNYTHGVGQTDAEGIERVWSGLGGVATSLKENGSWVSSQ